MEGRKQGAVPAMGRYAGLFSGFLSLLVERRPVWRSVRTVCATVLLLWACVAAATTYVHDSSGRLVVTKNDAGESARFIYDKMGNLARIERLVSSDLAIFDFTPGRGGPGAVVRISGQGFRAAVSENSVQFNGTPAAVSAATVDELTVAVPAGASTGPISVTVGSVTAVSTSDFVVDEHARPPVITAVSPLVTAIGLPVTVDGQHLAPIAKQTSVRIGGRSAQPSETTDVRVVFSVPSTAGSGKVAITTPYGTATSADDVVVVPAGIDPADVAQVKRLALDAPAQSLAVNVADRYAAVLFDSAGGEYLSAQFSTISVSSLNYTLYGVDNKKVASGTVSPGSPTFHLPKIAVSGTYLLLLKPVAAPANWNLAIERAGALPVDGVSLDIDTTVSAQSKRLIFNASAGMNLGLGLSDYPTPSVWTAATLYVYSPEGAQLGYQSCDQSKNGCALNLSGVRDGIHSIIIQPAQSGERKLGFRSTLSTDSVAALTRDAASTLGLHRRGQNGRWTFTGNAGDVIGLLIAGQTTVPAGRTVYYRIHKPDGSLWKSNATAAGSITNLPLPATGEYQVFVDPEYGETLTAQVLLSSGATASPDLDGVSSSFATSLPGQGIYFAVNATAGQNLGLGISELAVNSGSAISLNAYRPDGSLLASTVCYVEKDGCDLNLPKLSAGKYAVEILPSANDQTMAFKATLSSDATGVLARDVASPLAITRRGKNARLIFPGVVGDTIALRITGQTTTPVTSGAYYRIYKPDGSSLAATYATADKTLNVELPITGDYQVFVDPEYGATLATELKVVAGTVGVMELDGNSGKYETAAGQNVSLTFEASAGKGLGLGISDLVLNTGSYVSVFVYRPDGTQLDSFSCNLSNSGCGANIFKPVSGTYSVTIKPTSTSQTMKFRATLSSDVAATLTRDAPVALNLDRRGQNGWLSFSGTAGETVAVQFAGQATAPAGKKVWYGVFRPSDGQYAWKWVEAETGGVLNLSLPTTDTYRIYVDPYYGASATAQVTLSTGTTSGLVLDGASANFAGVPGQTAYFRFNATAGQNLGFGISDLVLNSGSYVNVYVNRPDGTQLDSFSCNVSNDGCGANLLKPVTGTYSVAVVPVDTNQTMQFKATLSSDLTATLTRDVPITLNLDRRGRNGWLSFSGTAGETVALQFAGQSTMPAGKKVWYGVFRPSDGQYAWKWVEAETGDVLNLSLPTTDTYRIYVDPYHGATATAQVTLSTGTTSGLVLNGASANIETGLPGQTAYFRFNATAGQNLGLGISELTLSSGTYVNVYVNRPDGTQLDSFSCNVSNGGCGANILKPVTGTYSVAVVPVDTEQAMQFKATLSSDVTATLTRDVPITLNLDRRGRNGWLSFSGTAGETVAVQFAGQSTMPAGKKVWYGVFRSSDGQYAWKWVEAETGGVLNLSLPTTDTYRIYVDPYHGATATAQVTLSTGTTSGLVLDGASANFAGVPGQTAYFRFNAAAGQNLGFGISDLALNSGSYVSVFVYRPDGTQLDSFSCNVSNSGCGANILKPVTGAYSVAVVPVDMEQAMQFKATLSSDVTATLTRDVPITLNLDRRGRNGWLSFSGTAGETVALQFAGQATAPAGKKVWYGVFRPSDGQYAWKWVEAETGGVLNLSLPTTDTYRIYVDPYHGATATAQVTLSTGTTSGLVLDGASANFAGVPGQTAYFRFNATAGQNLGFGISDLVLNSGSYVNVYVNRPDGTQLDSFSCNVSNDGCGANILKPVTGTYSVAVVPVDTEQAMQFKATLSSDLTATLTRDVPITLSLDRRGRNGWLSFSGTAGETVALQFAGQSTMPAGRKVWYGVFRPSDGQFSWKSVEVVTAGTLTLTLPTTSTYQVYMDPYYGATATAQVTLDSTP